MDLHDKLAKEKKIAIIWSIEDVKGLDSNLTDEQAWEILQAFENHHEGSMESMWDDLNFHILNWRMNNGR